MALDKTRLGDAIATAVDAISVPSDAPIDLAKKKEIWQAVADEVIKEFIANAIISTTVAVTSVSGVTSGPAVSGPGAGTGTGTIA